MILKLTLLNNNLRTFCYDSSNHDSVDKMFNSILKWYNRIDVLVNNAGIADFGKIEVTDLNRWNDVMATPLENDAVLSAAELLDSWERGKH